MGGDTPGGKAPGLPPPQHLAPVRCVLFPLFNSNMLYVLSCPKCKNIILSGIQTFLLQSNFSILLIFFPHVHIHISLLLPSPKSSPGTSRARRPAALATEPLGSRGARLLERAWCRGAVLPFHRLGTTVRRNSFWKRATVTTRVQVSVFVGLQILDGGRKARLGAITRKRLSSSGGILRIQSDKKKL